jgi:hypothetical protein
VSRERGTWTFWEETGGNAQRGYVQEKRQRISCWACSRSARRSSLPASVRYRFLWGRKHTDDVSRDDLEHHEVRDELRELHLEVSAREGGGLG